MDQLKYMEVLKMKTYNEILKDIEKTKKALKAAEQKENEITEKIYSVNDLITRREIKKELNAEIIKASEKIQDLKITIKLLNHNSKIALFNETIPVIIETLEKYKNKPYGEKTRAAISDTIKERTGCRCYISSRYTNSEINIYPAEYGKEITAGTTDKINILVDNKIQPVKAEDIKLYYIGNNYFDNIPAAIKAMKKAYKKAVEKQKELETICNEFNFYAVDGIERIYKDKYIYERFTV
jgi:hypothetical protein